jgi:hypothetical protein
MKTTVILVIFVGLGLLAVSLGAQNDQRAPAKEPSIRDILLGKDSAAMDNLQKAMIAQREGTVYSLIAVLDKSVNKKNNTFVEQGGLIAVYLLGELRAAAAVSPLADRIEVYPGVIWDRSPEGIFPCYAALVRIGTPASLECLKRLASEKFVEPENGRRSELLLRVVHEVEGDEVAKFMLQRAIEKEQDKDKKANLTAALALLEKWIKEREELEKELKEKFPPKDQNPPAPEKSCPSPDKPANP